MELRKRSNKQQHGGAADPLGSPPLPWMGGGPTPKRPCTHHGRDARPSCAPHSHPTGTNTGNTSDTKGPLQFADSDEAGAVCGMVCLGRAAGAAAGWATALPATAQLPARQQQKQHQPSLPQQRPKPPLPRKRSHLALTAAAAGKPAQQPACSRSEDGADSDTDSSNSAPAAVDCECDSAAQAGPAWWGGGGGMPHGAPAHAAHAQHPQYGYNPLCWWPGQAAGGGPMMPPFGPPPCFFAPPWPPMQPGAHGPPGPPFMPHPGVFGGMMMAPPHMAWPFMGAPVVPGVLVSPPVTAPQRTDGAQGQPGGGGACGTPSSRPPRPTQAHLQVLSAPKQEQQEQQQVAAAAARAAAAPGTPDLSAALRLRDVAALRDWVVAQYCEDVYLMLLDCWRADSPRAADAVAAWRAHMATGGQPDCRAFLTALFGEAQLAAVSAAAAAAGGEAGSPLLGRADGRSGEEGEGGEGGGEEGEDETEEQQLQLPPPALVLPSELPSATATDL